MKKYFIVPFLKRQDGSLMRLEPGPPTQPVVAARLNELFEKFAVVGQGADDPLDLLQPDDFVYQVQTVDVDDENDIPEGTWKRQGVLAVR